ncbi:MAG: MarR family transcriptional regulator [Clostridiaceae bacterium]|jgi:DNA-binding MarR family transcriptional regulator|nr:MarR family transcriptional regulator [Clostridiaceae bacterium]
MGKIVFADVECVMVRLFNRYMELSKRKHEYCEGIALYPSEIHTLEYIALSNPANLTEIAVQMVLSKGAVSKMVNKLERLGLVERYKFHEKQKDIYLHLTESGVRAYEGHKQYHATMWNTLSAYLDQLDDGKRYAILEFLHEYLQCMHTLQG